MKCIINKQEEYLMILLVNLQINRETLKASYVEDLSKQLFKLHFDSFNFTCGLTEDEKDKLEFADVDYNYEELKKDGAINTFRKAAERMGYDYEYTEE